MCSKEGTPTDFVEENNRVMFMGSLNGDEVATVLLAMDRFDGVKALVTGTQTYRVEINYPPVLSTLALRDAICEELESHAQAEGDGDLDSEAAL
jgi:hypothetical protein